MPSHSSCLNSFAPSLFQSLTQKAQTQAMKKKLTIRLNAIQVDPKQKRKGKGEKKMKEICGLQVSRGHPAECFFVLVEDN